MTNQKNQPLAVCGINCNKCPVYMATISEDYEPLKDFARRGSLKWGVPEAVFMAMKCWGCQQDDNPRIDHCSDCETRNCARLKGLDNCAYCEAFDTCNILLTQNNEAIQPSRENLIQFRADMNL